jgi:hypothetical protein
MTTRRRKTPDLFADTLPDPVAAAGGGPRPAAAKRKAGFYISAALVQRFDRKFYELKLAGAAVGNKSALLEAALAHALDDLDRGAASQILKRLRA